MKKHLLLLCILCLGVLSLFRTDVSAEEGTAQEAGKRMVKTVDGIEYAFRWCPPGTFIMGSQQVEDDYIEYDGELEDTGYYTPHQVTLTRGFWILETEVTQEMWESIMGTNVEEQWAKSSYGRFPKEKDRWLPAIEPRFPMYYVNHEECRNFCWKLSWRLEMEVKLPTEAQWEYACRAGTTEEFAGILDSMGWYALNSKEMLHHVGQKKPNAWGLCDMYGNVWEWCSDKYRKYPDEHVTDPEDLSSAAGAWFDGFRVTRGGGWKTDAGHCRSAIRGEMTQELRNCFTGFRVVLPAPVQ